MSCKHLILLFFIVFTFNACGVETSSSSVSLNENTDNTTGSETNTTTGSETNTTTGSETNTTTGSETNTTTGSETNTTTGSETNTTSSPDNEIISIFEINDAQLDLNACGATGYTAITDNSFDPEGFLDGENGIKILSVLPINFNPKKSEVLLYFPTFTKTLTDKFSVIVKDFYWISYDNAWPDNENNTVYVKTPTDIDGKYLCERFILNSTTPSSISATKVYRVTN